MEKGNTKREAERREDLKFRAAGILQIAKGTASLPLAPIALVQGNTRKNLENVEKLKRIAVHEIGHMLVMLFQGQKVRGVYVLRNKILAKRLGMPRGVTTEDNPASMFAVAAICGDIADGILKTVYGRSGVDFDFDQMSEAQKANFIINALAGEAAESSEQSDGLREDFHANDLTSDLSKLKSTLESSKELKKSADEVIETFYAELVSFFREPRMQRILVVLMDELLKTDYFATFRKSLDKKVVQILEKNGITKAEFEEEKERFQTLIARFRSYLNGYLND